MNNCILKLRSNVKFLKEKCKVSAENLNREEESNTNLFTTIKMAKETVFTDRPDSATNEEKKKFLSETNCMELLNTVYLKGETTYLIESLLNTVPLYRPEDVMFVKTDNQLTVALQICMYTDYWDNFNVKELNEKQERRITTSGGSSSSQADSHSKL